MQSSTTLYAQEMLSEERRAPVNEKEFLRLAAELVLGSEADGTISGRKRVPGSSCHVGLRPDQAGGMRRNTEDGPIPSDDDGISCDAEVLIVE